MERKAKKILISLAKTALTVLFWLGLWLILYEAVSSDVLIASPVDVFRRLWEFLPEREFRLSILNSFSGVAKGYILGVLSGVALGIATSFSKTLSALLRPFLTTVKTTPVVSFIILALIWLPKFRVPVFITVLMVLPVIWANVAGGILGTDKSLIEMANAYNFGFTKKLKLIYLPSAVPPFITACETAVGMGWKAGIAAEVLCSPQNTIGMNLKNSQIYLETVDLFAWTAVVIILSLILEKALVYLLDLVLKRLMIKGGYFIDNKNK